MSAEALSQPNIPPPGEPDLLRLSPKERLLTQTFTDYCWEHGINPDAIEDPDRPVVSAIAHDLLLHVIGQHNQRQLERDPTAPTIVIVNAGRVERHLEEYYQTVALASSDRDTVRRQRHETYLETNITQAERFAGRFTEVGLAMHLQSALGRVGKGQAALCVKALVAAYGKSFEHHHV